MLVCWCGNPTNWIVIVFLTWRQYHERAYACQRLEYQLGFWSGPFKFRIQQSLFMLSVCIINKCFSSSNICQFWAQRTYGSRPIRMILGKKVFPHIHWLLAHIFQQQLKRIYLVSAAHTVALLLLLLLAIGVVVPSSKLYLFTYFNSLHINEINEITEPKV